jgi:hypothetical protein
MPCVERPLVREALFAATAAALVATALLVFAPPGADLAAHIYQRGIFVEHGFSLWNNLWYAGRYSFVTYSVLYYPLAAVLGIGVLAVATVATAALAFTVVVLREWGPAATWSCRTFAVVWGGITLTAEFPFALGVAIALLSLWALQSGRRVIFALLAVASAAASPLAFLLLCVVLAGLWLDRRPSRAELVLPVSVVAAVVLVLAVIWRAFPGGGTYPFSPAEAAAAFVFCLIGIGVSWRIASARLLRFVFAVYLVACLASFLIPSTVGENVARLRLAAIPLAVLTLSLRAWRPRPVALAVLLLATSWNLTPLAANVATAAANPASREEFWTPAVDFLREHLTSSYRVEAVDTSGHWPAVYLARAGIPLVRGWYRQDDFPQNRLLYERFGPTQYLTWLRRMGVRYVVTAEAPTDYSARFERRLIESGRSGLRQVLRTPTVTIYEVPNARPIVVGPGRARVLRLLPARLVVRLERPGRYRVAIRRSPYWHTSSGCLSPSADGMLLLDAPRAGVVTLRFDVDPGRALEQVAGAVDPRVCAA